MSIIGVISVLFTALFMSVRALDGTYAAGGKYLSTLSDNFRPSFGRKELNIYTPSTLVFTSMVSSAFLCHFCAPDFYHNLRANTLSRFKTLTVLGFSATMLINTLMMCMGFVTFSGGSSGMVLNNYSSKDIGATFCRLLMCINLIGSYPFVFGAMKSSFISMTPLKGMSTA
jgi:amino acid permease